jgi:transposase-like protein
VVEPHELVERSPKRVEKEAHICDAVSMKTTQTQQMNASTQFCPNEACKARGQVGQGTIVVHGRKRPRYKCTTCGRTFSARVGTSFAGLRKPVDLIVIVVTLTSLWMPAASHCPCLWPR